MTDQGPTRSARGLDIGTAFGLADLAHELGHGKGREEFAKVVRKYAPDSLHAKAFPDVEMKERQEAWEQQQKDEAAKQKQAEWATRLTSQRQALLDGGADGTGPKYDEDTVKKIEKLMEQKGIFDYEDGRVLYAATQPQPQKPDDLPPAPNSRTWEFPDFEKFAKDPNRAAQETAYAMIHEFNRHRKRA
jgi:ATP-dependent exoDNAse (exonuclease V) alpha subunit